MRTLIVAMLSEFLLVSVAGCKSGCEKAADLGCNRIENGKSRDACKK